ncbi:MAG: IclR family transcriptional regulator [Gaiellaceae bacterium]
MARALRLVDLLASDQALAEGGLGVSRVAELLRRDKSQVSRTLKVLHEEGLVDRDAATMVYRPGWKLFAYGARAGQPTLTAAAPQILESLSAATSETAHLSVLKGAEILTVASRAGDASVQAMSWVGRAVPAHCTSAGRAILFDHDDAALERLLGAGPYPQPTAKAPRTLAQLARRLEADRRRGFAIVADEFEPGLVGVSAPVRDARGQIVASINVSGPAFRFGNRAPATGSVVVEAATSLSRLLGNHPQG